MLELVEGCIDIDINPDNSSEVIQGLDNIKQKRKKPEPVKNKISKTKSSKSTTNKASTTVAKSKKKKEPKINQKYDNASSMYIDQLKHIAFFKKLFLFFFRDIGWY